MAHAGVQIPVPCWALRIPFPATAPRAVAKHAQDRSDKDSLWRMRGFRFPSGRGLPSASVAHSVTPMACHLSHGERLCRTRGEQIPVRVTK